MPTQRPVLHVHSVHGLLQRAPNSPKGYARPANMGAVILAAAARGAEHRA